MNFANVFGTPHFHAVCLVVVSAAVIEALVAIWAATSRVHWFWRAIAVWAAVSVLLPIRAYQPALLFAVTSPLTTAIILSINSRRGASTPRPFRFGLRDLLLATAVIALALTSLLHLVPRLGEAHLAEFTLTAIIQTAIPTLVWAASATNRRRSCYAAILAVIVGVAIAAHSIPRPLSYDWALVGVLFESRWRFQDVEVVALAAGELTLLLLAALRISLSLRERVSAEGGRVSALRMSLLLSSASWLLCLAVIYCNMLWLQPLPPTFEGGTNNYHRLLELPKSVKTLNVAEQLAAIDEAVALVEDANFVPYDLPHDVSYDNWNKRFIAPVQQIRDLARAIDAECKAARSSGDKVRACTLALTNVRLGLMFQRGSTVIECLIGVAVQGLANQRLIELRSELSPDDARRVIAAWDRALAEAESVHSIVNRDAAMAERAYGWAARLANIVDWAGFPEVYSAVREADLRRQATTRLLQTDLAIRLYREDHGRLPARLLELIPSYLSGLPLDPYSGESLIYRTNGDEFTLYSVGKDRIDDGGKLTNMRTYYSQDGFGNFVRGYDYDLDTTTRP